MPVIYAWLKTRLPASFKLRLRRGRHALQAWLHALERSIVAVVNLACFALAHRKFRGVVDQRAFWEGRWERDVAALETEPYYQQLSALMLSQVQSVDGDLLLEIGCHAGYHLRKFALGAPHRHFVGLDLGLANMVGGRSRLGQLPNVSLVNANAAALPFADASIDVVYTYVSLTHIDYATIDKVMAEIDRVVRRHVVLCEVDERPMQWRNKLRVINIGYFFLHRYESLVTPALKLLSITPVPDLAGHPRYTLFRFDKAAAA